MSVAPNGAAVVNVQRKRASRYVLREILAECTRGGSGFLTDFS